MGSSQAQVIGRKVRIAREAKGLRPEDLAAETGIGFRTISRVESGETKRMRLDTANLLSQALDIPVSELRPPKIADDDDVHKMLSDVLSRLQRIESAVGVEEPHDDVAAQDADEEAHLPNGPSGLPSAEQGRGAAR